MTLQEQGFRFVKRGAKFLWVHPADLAPVDTDCTDMNDDAFAMFVEQETRGKPCT